MFHFAFALATVATLGGGRANLAVISVLLALWPVVTLAGGLHTGVSGVGCQTQQRQRARSASDLAKAAPTLSGDGSSKWPVSFLQ